MTQCSRAIIRDLPCGLPQSLQSFSNRLRPPSVQGERFLAVEVMQEPALGEPGSFADVLDERGGIAFGRDYMQGRIEELSLRYAPLFRPSS
jgi:hypothetical protein